MYASDGPTSRSFLFFAEILFWIPTAMQRDLVVCIIFRLTLPCCAVLPKAVPLYG